VESSATEILEIIEGLACPLCKGDLRGEQGRLFCKHCRKQYGVVNNIPCMLTDETSDFEEEITVQDNVADQYESKRYSDKYARMYHDWWTDLMIKHITVTGRVLDNGCGVGHILERFGPDEAVGLDISMNMLRHASRKSKRLVLGSSQQLPFKANFFDAVFCRGLLHHLPRPDQGIGEIHRVIKPKGEVVFVDPNATLISYLPRLIVRGGKQFSHDHKSFTQSIFKKMLHPYFSIDKVVYFGYIAYPLLAFPDLLNIFKYVPFKPFVAKAVMGFDHIISKIPLLRTQSWAIMVKATALELDSSRSESVV